VQRLQHLEHAGNIVVRKVVLGRLLKPIIPNLMPQNGSPDEFRADKLGLKCISLSHSSLLCGAYLIYNHRGMLPHLIRDARSHSLSRRDIRLGGDSQWVDERLRVGAADIV
jgi:hypothetical protein